MNKLFLYKTLFKSAFSKHFIYAKSNAKQYTFQNLIFLTLLTTTIVGGYVFFDCVDSKVIEITIHPAIFLSTLICTVFFGIYCVSMLFYNSQVFGAKLKNIIYLLFGKFFGLQYSDLADNFATLYPIFEQNKRIETLQNLMNTLDDSEISAWKRHDSLKDFHKTLKLFLKNPEKNTRKSFETLQSEYLQKNDIQDLHFFDNKNHH